MIAAEVTIDSPDFGHLEPMVNATQRELASVGVSELPGTVVADAGYWHKQQMENVVAAGMQVLIPPDSGNAQTPRPGWDKGLLRVHAPRARHRLRPGGLPKTDGHGRAGVRADQVQPRVRPLPTTRTIRRALGVAISSRDPQPPQAPQATRSPPQGPERPPKAANPTGQTAKPAPRRAALRTAPRPFTRQPPRERSSRDAQGGRALRRPRDHPGRRSGRVQRPPAIAGSRAAGDRIPEKPSSRLLTSDDRLGDAANTRGAAVARFGCHEGTPWPVKHRRECDGDDAKA